ncbi:hypothetical protein [Streptomyces formicae]|uniref:Secreted protein n=1 Tax=Streptomyces formicae TaxID=1616117 RepID=A0A291QEU5_9ACTN|nr:hypothetical protein [Streptomyces formicae]ATL29955.1 hypothetical protein KY5_4937c [Streptomyces formicae]
MGKARGAWGSAVGLAAATALVVLSAPHAVAGGPTSVLLVSPESTEAAALYNNDARYGQLERSLEPAGALDGPGEQPPGLGIGESTRQINITWMVHDVSTWRVDRVYPPLSGKKGADVWVHRSTDVASLNGTWYKARDPERLRSLLKQLGLMGKASQEGHSGIAPSDEETPAAPAAPEKREDPQAAEARGGSGGSSDTEWWWAIPGAGAGAVAALLLRGPVTEGWAAASAWRRRPQDRGPRQKLRDL